MFLFYFIDGMGWFGLEQLKSGSSYDFHWEVGGAGIGGLVQLRVPTHLVRLPVNSCFLAAMNAVDAANEP